MQLAQYPKAKTLAIKMLSTWKSDITAINDQKATTPHS